jgi:membrane associated rhomboid family serine protease/Tfp pilus assembly protein PilF
VTRALLVAIGIVFGMTVIASVPFGVRPLLESDLRVLLNFGANVGPLVAAGDLWRLVASIFLHANLLHLVLNAIALYVLGRNLEAFYGPWGFLFLFVASGIVGSVASAVTAQGISVGASGGIFGMFGASLLFAFRYRGVLPPRVTRIMGTLLLPWVVLNVALGLFFPRIDLVAHLGGLLGGATIALFLPPVALRASAGRPSDAPRLLASLTLSILLVTAVTAGMNLMRFKGPNGALLDPRAIPALGRIDPVLAIAIATEEIDRNPYDPQLYSARADQLVVLEQWLDAIHDYQTALEIDSYDAGTLNNFAWLLLEMAPEGLRNWTEAGRLATRALRESPENPYVLGTYGTWLLRTGEPAAAAGYLRRALSVSRPAEADATDRYLLAIALARSGRPIEAEEMLESAIRVDPDNAYRGEAESSSDRGTQAAPSL